MSQNLSVVLSVYNAMPYLSEAVESILRQTYEDFSLIIINDGSTDGSLEHLRSLEDPRIVLIDQENMGLGFSLNVGLRLCKSKYVARMDADDVSLPGRFAAQIEFLEANPNIVMVGTQVEFLIRNRVQKALRVPTNHDDIRSRLFVGRAGLCHPSVMFRTGAAIACGGYPVGIIGEDIDFFLRMCEQGTVANFRSSPTSLSSACRPAQPDKMQRARERQPICGVLRALQTPRASAPVVPRISARLILDQPLAAGRRGMGTSPISDWTYSADQREADRGHPSTRLAGDLPALQNDSTRYSDVWRGVRCVPMKRPIT
jgi:hypothetical protein